MKARIMGRDVEISEDRVRSVGRSVKEQAHASLGALAASSPFFTFLLNGQISGGKNNILVTRQGRRIPNKSFSKWLALSLAQLPAVRPTYTTPVHLIVDYVRGDDRRRDMPALLDALCHLLEKANLLLDDKQVVSLRWNSYPMDREAPSCRVTLEAR